MVLVAPEPQGLDQGGAPGRASLPGPSSDHHREGGSQAIEFAMVLPLATLMLSLLGIAGILGADIVAAEGLAREVARTAAIAGVDEARARAVDSAENRKVDVQFTPARPAPGEAVVVVVHLESRALASIGLDVRIPAQATMSVERP